VVQSTPAQVQPVAQDNSKLEAILNASRNASLSIIDRVFRRNITKQIKKWQYNAHPERKLEYVHSEITKKSKEEYDYIAKIGALETITKISTTTSTKAKGKAFRSLI